MRPFAFLATAVCAVAVGFAQESGKLTIEIPAAVQATIAKEKGDTGKVVEFKRLNENDGATYAITLEIDGKSYEMILDGAGRVMRKEVIEGEPESHEVEVQKLPEAIKKTFYREAAGAALKTVEVREEKKTYRTEILVNRRRYSIEVDAAGKLISKRFEGEAEEN
jgi:uncharacterized membrane protein YkoI